MVRFELLTPMTVGDLRTAGFELEPTGRDPLHFILGLEYRPGQRLTES